MRPAMLAVVVVFWVVGVVLAWVLNDGIAIWVRLISAAAWTYLSFVIAKKWVVKPT